jgi:hypothetical protein
MHTYLLALDLTHIKRIEPVLQVRSGADALASVDVGVDVDVDGDREIHALNLGRTLRSIHR